MYPYHAKLENCLRHNPCKPFFRNNLRIVSFLNELEMIQEKNLCEDYHIRPTTS